jgi:ankyrin repeat protein
MRTTGFVSDKSSSSSYESDFTENEDDIIVCGEDDDDDSEQWSCDRGEIGEPDRPHGDPWLEKLLEAAEGGNLLGAEEALEKLSVSCSTLGDDGDSALHLASLFGHGAIVEKLLVHGANPAQRDCGGGLALHDACASGHIRIAELLLGAAPDTLHTVDDDGDTALHNAARGNHREIVDLLLAKGAKADLGLVNLDGERPCDSTDDPQIRHLLSI